MGVSHCPVPAAGHFNSASIYSHSTLIRRPNLLSKTHEPDNIFALMIHSIVSADMALRCRVFSRQKNKIDENNQYVTLMYLDNILFNLFNKRFMRFLLYAINGRLLIINYVSCSDNFACI